jgi:hypothetical protein
MILSRDDEKMDMIWITGLELGIDINVLDVL